MGLSSLLLRVVMVLCQGFLPRETLLVRRRSLLVVLLQGRDQVEIRFTSSELCLSCKDRFGASVDVERICFKRWE